MRRVLALMAVGCAVLAAQAATELSVEELIALHRAGLSEETILQYVDKYDICVPLGPADLVAMADAGVPETLIQALVGKMAGCEAGESSAGKRAGRGRTYGFARPGYYYGPVCCPTPYYVYDPFFYDPFFFSFGFAVVHDPFFLHPHRHHHGFFHHHHGFGVHPRRVGTGGPALRTRPPGGSPAGGARLAPGASGSRTARSARPRGR